MSKTLSTTKTAKGKKTVAKTPTPSTYCHLVIQAKSQQSSINHRGEMCGPYSEAALVAEIAYIDMATMDTPMHDPEWRWLGVDSDTAAGTARLIQIAKDEAFADGYRQITIEYPRRDTETQRILPARTRKAA